MTYHLIIKGLPAQAQAAAESRGFAIVADSKSLGCNQSRVTVSSDDELYLVDWFSAPPILPLVPGFGYPVGTLLYYCEASNV